MRTKALGQTNIQVAPIASATSLERLKELTDAAALDLSAGDMALLNEASRW